MLTVVNNNNNNNNIIFLKKQYRDVRRAGKKDIVQRKLNWEFYWQIFPTTVWNVLISITHSFIIDCFMYTLLHLNPFFLDQKFDVEYDECVRMLWTYLIPNEFYILTCKHDNYNVSNKLSLKYKNPSEIIDDFIVENNEHLPRLKEYFKRNAQVYAQVKTFTLDSFENTSVR